MRDLSGVHPPVATPFGEDGEPREPHYEKSFAGFIETLAWYARAMRAAVSADGG